MGILAGFMVPHPPMIVPEVGRGSEERVIPTKEAYEKVAMAIRDLEPEVLVITSPHSVMYADYFHISPGENARGSFQQFRAPQVSFSETYDTELAEEIERLCRAEDFPAGTMGERDASLDHGTMVPLYFIRKYYTKGKILRIGLSGLPLTEHYYFGTLIRKAVENLGRRAVIVASGDLSHKLQDYGPYGFDPAGPVYDKRIMEDAGRGDFGAFLEYEEDFLEQAAECGHRSFTIMAGAFDGTDVKAEALSHQDVTGVGYGICTFYPKRTEDENSNSESQIFKESRNESLNSDRPYDENLNLDESNGRKINPQRQFLRIFEERRKEEAGKFQLGDPYVFLARETIRRHLTGEQLPYDSEALVSSLNHFDQNSLKTQDVQHALEDSQNALEDSQNALEDFQKALEDFQQALKEMQTIKAGVFVSLHEAGRLRGCIGTFLPTTDSVYEEILQNAVSAASRDPRFSPVRFREFPYLDINVDVLSAPEPIDSEAELDPKRYGVIVESGRRRGLLLPDLEGVDTVEDQIAIARQKAGIDPDEPVKLRRFTVTRHI